MISLELKFDIKFPYPFIRVTASSDTQPCDL
jgi:hypothetical protein